jgi:hypothetical protein
MRPVKVFGHSRELPSVVELVVDLMGKEWWG